MFTTSFIALIAASSVLARPPVLSRRGDVALSDWTSDLESYWRYKVRYNSLDCGSQRDTPFYEECCSPLAAGASLSDRPDYCTPAALTCSAPGTPAPAPETPAPETPAPETPDVPAPVDVPAPAPAPVPVPDNDDDLPYCEEGDDGEDYDDDDDNYIPTVPTPETPAPETPAPETPSPPQNLPGDVVTGGFATWYLQGGNAGACGDFHSDDDHICAIDHERYGDNFGVKSSECGRVVRIKNPSNGNTVDCTIADVCPTCDNGNSIDMSLGAFQVLAGLDVGHFPIEWSYLS